MFRLAWLAEKPVTGDDRPVMVRACSRVSASWSAGSEQWVRDIDIERYVPNSILSG